MEPAKVVLTEAETYFQQGSIQFAVDRYDLMRVLGAGSWYAEGSVLDRLTDASLVALAVSNDLPVEPFSRDLLRSPLHGVIMLAWYRDVENRELTESLIKNHTARIEKYLRDLETLRRRLAALESGKPDPEKARRASKPMKLGRRYRLAKNVDVEAYGGQEGVILKLIQRLGEPTFADLVRAAEKEIKTKLKLERVITYRINYCIKSGVVEQLGAQLKAKEK